MGQFVSFSEDQVAPLFGAVLGALTWEGGSPTELQLDLLQSFLHAFASSTPLIIRELSPSSPEQAKAELQEGDLVKKCASLVTVLELTMHPLPDGLVKHSEEFLRTIGTEPKYLNILQDTAEEHTLRLHADLMRNSWYTEETIKGVFSGRLSELLRSKLSYYSLATDHELASKWRGLRNCPEGSWGHGVARFYDQHGFAFPGEKNGIYEVGAFHDWVHVLADYGPSPEGEIDVFAFIAATMQDERGFIQFIFTLALFQNATITTVGGKHVNIARADTLSEPGAVDHLVDAFWRAKQCTQDVMGGVDHFALADIPLEELRQQWGIPPKRFESPGAFEAFSSSV
ncbi:MAG: hypothetical protein WD029_01945 [Microthrixaceae bacterium]